MGACVAGKRSKHWTTFNEPTVAANCGWALGNHPPGKLLHFKVQSISLFVLLLFISDHSSSHAAVPDMTSIMSCNA